MFHPTRSRDQIRLLAAKLELSPVELLILAREAAHDGTLLSVNHLKAIHLGELVRLLKEADDSIALAQQVRAVYN